MRAFKTIFDFYLSSSIHVAISVFALSWLTLLEYGLPFDAEMLWFIFFSSITGYNFVKYFGLAKFHHRSLARWLRVIQVFSLLSFLLLCFFATRLDINTLIYVGVLGVVTFLYAMPLLPKLFLDEKKNLRSVSGLKIYVIAFVWTGVTVILPLINSHHALTEDVWLTALQRFVFVMVLMLPFEIRDLSYDSIKLATIPQQIGVTKTILLGIVLLFVFNYLEFLKSNLYQLTLLSNIIISVIVFLFLIGSKRHQNPYYTAFWVEAIPIWWLLLMLVF
ncbi:hypothetical protein ACU8DI_11735 [Psychroserpens sp. BH13MA-6]